MITTGENSNRVSSSTEIEEQEVASTGCLSTFPVVESPKNTSSSTVNTFFADNEVSYILIASCASSCMHTDS